jgi:large conductance mechanosensitive channel protein
VSSLVKDVIMPPIGWAMGGIDFSNFFLTLKGPATATLAEAQKAGAVTINYGLFINTIINFMIVALALFVLIRAINRLHQPAAGQSAGGAFRAGRGCDVAARDPGSPESTLVRSKVFAAFGAAFVMSGVCLAYSTFHPSDGIPDAKGCAKYAPFISSALEKLLAQGAEAEQAFAKANKDSPPLIEGDLFTSNFEGATSFKVGACQGDAKAGHCTIALTYDDRKSSPKDKPLNWNDTVYLVATPSGWRVDDIGYGGSWDFGNKGRMGETVKGAIANASE